MKARQRRRARRKHLRHKKAKIAGIPINSVTIIVGNRLIAATLGIHSALVPRMLYLFAQLYQSRVQLAQRLTQQQKDIIVGVFKQMTELTQHAAAQQQQQRQMQASTAPYWQQQPPPALVS